MFTQSPVILDITQKCIDYEIFFDKVTMTISYTAKGIFINLNGSCMVGKNRGVSLSSVFRFTDMFFSLENSFWKFTTTFGIFPERFRVLVFNEIYRIHIEKQRYILGKVNKK